MDGEHTMDDLILVNMLSFFMTSCMVISVNALEKSEVFFVVVVCFLVFFLLGMRYLAKVQELQCFHQYSVKQV
jgi:hypothetical protein